MTRNKKRELYWLERFQHRAELEFEILDDYREKPDFLIRFNNRHIGVEITELHVDQSLVQNSKGSELRKIHETRADIVRRAQKLYFENGYNPINARFLFKESSKLLAKADRNELVYSIVDALRQLHLDKWERRRLDRCSKPAVPQSIAAIHALGLPEKCTPYWQMAGAGWARTLRSDDIKLCLDRKNLLIQNYQQVVCENWLLIVADGFWPHGMFRVPEQDQENWPESKFQRTYFLLDSLISAEHEWV